MSSSVTLAFEILAKDKASKHFDNVGSSVDNVGGKLGKLGHGFATFGKVAAVGLGAAAVGAVALGKSFVDAAIESQKVTKQTEAVIKSMGGASNVTAQQVADLSEKLSMQSGVDDELIQSGQNVLLTFGKVQNKVGKGNKIFDRATEAALNMSVALGTDMQGATIQVGKALNDPIKGITALSRAGVSFSAKQKDQIKTLVFYGKNLEAQKIILGELEKQFGGSAAAQATAGDKLKVIWGNLQEDLGMRLIPVFESVASWLTVALPAALDFVRPIFGEIAGGVSAFVAAFMDGGDEVTSSGFAGFIENLGVHARNAADALGGFVSSALEALSNWWGSNGDNITGFFKELSTQLGNIAEPVGAWLWETALPKLKEAGEWLIARDETLPVVLGAIAGGFAAWAANAALAAIASWAAIAPLLPFIAVGAAAAAIYYLLADRGDGWLDVLIRTGMAVAVVGSQIVGFFQTIWRWAQKAYEVASDLYDKIQDILDLSPNLPVPGAQGGPSFPLESLLPGPLQPLFGGGFDDGGVVPGPRGAPRLIMAHAGETVSPTHKTGAFDAVGEDQLLELRMNNRLLMEQNGILRGLAGGGVSSWRGAAAVM